MIYGGSSRKNSYLTVEDVLRHEMCHILICLPEHWAEEGYAMLSENTGKQDDRLKYAYLVQKKLPDTNILEKFFTEYDLSNFDNFLRVMDENKTKAYYGISFTIASWLVEKNGFKRQLCFIC